MFIFFLMASHIQANDDNFSEEDKACLLNISRQTLISYLSDGRIFKVDENNLDKSLLLKRACFVTLHKKGAGLRGCIGLFEPSQSIYKNVIDRSIAAATRDPRFPPVTYDELKDIKIDISILTVPEIRRFKSPDDLRAPFSPPCISG